MAKYHYRLVSTYEPMEEDRLNREIFPEGTGFVHTEEGELSYTAVFDADKNEIGRIFTVRPSGYGGPIVVKAGFDSENRVRGVRILEHAETPGLGAKITENSFLGQFKNKSGNELYLKKYHSEGTVDAVTGATISSKAVSDGILKLREKLLPLPSPSREED